MQVKTTQPFLAAATFLALASPVALAAGISRINSVLVPQSDPIVLSGRHGRVDTFGVEADEIAFFDLESTLGAVFFCFSFY